jgi:hypothetical protein
MTTRELSPVALAFFIAMIGCVPPPAPTMREGSCASDADAAPPSDPDASHPPDEDGGATLADASDPEMDGGGVVDPPPPPPPPPPTADCAPGWATLEDCWAGWCGDEARNFECDGSDMIMHSNAEGNRWVGEPGVRYAAGSVSFEFYFETDRIPAEGGGKHHFGVHSTAPSFGDDDYRGWLRPDVLPRNRSGTYSWDVHTYNLDGNGDAWFPRGGGLDVVADVWSTDIEIPGTRRWIPMEYSWERRGDDELWVRLSSSTGSAERTIGIHPESRNLYRIALGNMDSLGSFGGTPQIRYRSFVIENLEAE